MDNFAGADAAFSIGNMIELGLKYGVKLKDWYGPSTVIQIFDTLNKQYSPFPNLHTVAFPDGVIYKDAILAQACDLHPEKTAPTTASDWKHAVIVMVGYRLGVDTIPPENYGNIFRMFDVPQCVGMVGGQGHGALYFLGYQDGELIFLDPHVTYVSLRC